MGIIGNIAKALQKENRPSLKGDKGALQFDLLYQLSYMSVIASAGVPRKQIFERSATLSCGTSDYFQRIELMYERLKYDYAKGCKIVGETAKEEEVRGILLRFSNSLLSGEPEADFLQREAEAHANEFESQYSRKIESLKTWTDAYVSLILSAVLIVIIGIVSTMIYEIETLFVFGLVGAAIGTTLMGAWVIYLFSPKERVVLKKPGTSEQKMANRLFFILLPVSAVICALVLVSSLGFGWALLLGGLLMFPVGWITVKDDTKVRKRELELAPLLGSLGGVCAAIGTTVKEAIGRIDLDAVDNLRTEIKALHTRMLAGINGKLCWNKFVEETGSELTNRSVGMFYDAIDLGGEPQAAGYNASIFTSKIAQLRTKRRAVSGTFRWLCIAMHTAVVALLIFITEIMGIFGELLAGATASISDMSAVSASSTVAGLASFNFGGLQMLSSMLVPLTLVFTVSNALVPTFVEGGSRYKFCYNFAFTAVITGLALIALPPMADMLFNVINF